LNFNPTALYAPSDYKNEENFLKFARHHRALELSLDQINEQLEKTKAELVDQLKDEAGKLGTSESDRISKIAVDQINLISRYVESARVIGEDFASTADSPLPHSALQADILKFLATTPEGKSASEIGNALRMSEAATHRAASKLAKRGLLEVSPEEPALFARKRSA